MKKKTKRTILTSVITLAVATATASGLVALNNTFNDDHVEVVKTTVIDLEKEQKNLIHYDPVQGGYLDSQKGTNNFYQLRENDHKLSFLNYSNDLVIAFNGLKEFTKYFDYNADHFCFFSTKEIKSLEFYVENGFYYGSPSVMTMVDIQNNPISHLESIMPEECWSTLIDEDCTSKEMSDFIDGLYVYNFNLEDFSLYYEDNELTTGDIIQKIKIIYF